MVARLPIRSSWKRSPLFLRAALATLPVLAVTVYLYLESRSFERQLLEAETTREADYALLQLQSFVAARIDALRSVGSFVARRLRAATTATSFPRFVNRLLADVPDLETVSLDRCPRQRASADRPAAPSGAATRT